jgi:N-acetylglucosaminyl-diphospho-decaprenol L-rhamnosyltransferase
VSGPFQGGPDPARVAVVVVSYETRDALLLCLDTLVQRLHLPAEVVVVDNASTDGSPEGVAARHPRARLLANAENRGFSVACNQGWRATAAPLVLFLNPDAEIAAGAVEALVGLLEERSDAGIVGPRTLFADGTVQVSTGPDLAPLAELRQRRLVRGVFRRDPAAVARAEARHRREHEPGWVSGSCLLARRQAIEDVGGFDEGFFLYEEDADLCRRVRAAGWRVVFTPAAEIRHHLGQSMARDPVRARTEYERSHLRYYRKHNGAGALTLLRLGLLSRSLAGLASADPARRRLAQDLLQLGLRGA